MAIVREPQAGHWPHFTRYEIVDGGIRPARGAEMILSSPWYREPGQKKPPYETLVNLDLVRDPEKTDQVALLDWISRHGVLGVLPHETLAATLWPRWRRIVPPSTTLAARESRADGRRPLVPSVTTYYRDGGRFHSQRRPFNQTGKIAAVVQRDGRANLESEPVNDPMVKVELRAQGWSEPEVVRLPLVSGQLIAERLGDAWGRYFLRPGVRANDRETWHYPQPLTADFWDAYVEPLGEFLAAARMLRRALEELTATPHGYEQAGGKTLSRLLAPMGLDLVLGADGLRESWRGPSLLSMLAAMAALDTMRARVRMCRCGNVVTNEDPRVEYCSPKCRWKYHQRDYRARLRAKKRPRGKSAKRRNGR